MVDSFDIDDLFVSDRIRCIEHEYQDLHIVENIILEVSFTDIDKMLRNWHSLVWSNNDVYKITTEYMDNLNPLCWMLLNAYHQRVILEYGISESEQVDEDMLLSDIIY